MLLQSASYPEQMVLHHIITRILTPPAFPPAAERRKGKNKEYLKLISKSQNVDSTLPAQITIPNIIP
jgi:hypothetical protein